MSEERRNIIYFHRANVIVEMNMYQGLIDNIELYEMKNVYYKGRVKEYKRILSTLKDIKKTFENLLEVSS